MKNLLQVFRVILILFIVWFLVDGAWGAFHGFTWGYVELGMALAWVYTLWYIRRKKP